MTVCDALCRRDQAGARLACRPTFSQARDRRAAWGSRPDAPNDSPAWAAPCSLDTTQLKILKTIHVDDNTSTRPKTNISKDVQLIKRISAPLTIQVHNTINRTKATFKCLFHCHQMHLHDFFYLRITFTLKVDFLSHNRVQLTRTKKNVITFKHDHYSLTKNKNIMRKLDTLNMHIDGLELFIIFTRIQYIPEAHPRERC